MHHSFATEEIHSFRYFNCHSRQIQQAYLNIEDKGGGMDGWKRVNLGRSGPDSKFARLFVNRYKYILHEYILYILCV